jgi:hypothetical protein
MEAPNRFAFERLGKNQPISACLAANDWLCSITEIRLIADGADCGPWFLCLRIQVTASLR